MGPYNLRNSRIVSRHSVSAPGAVKEDTLSARQFQCDCACENGTDSNPVLHETPRLASTRHPDRLTPRIYPELFRFQQAERLCLYNPQADAGVVVLDSTGAKIWELAEQGLTLEQIFKEIRELDHSAAFEDLLRLLRELESCKLLYFTPEPPALDIAPSRSLSVWLHVSNQCNLRCTYCYLGKTSETMSLETGKKVINNLIESARFSGMQKLTLKFAGGEALLEWPLVLALYRYTLELALPLGLEVQPIILSNGTTITASIAQRLKEHGFYVAISLDGLGMENDVQRPFVNGGGSFRAIERGLLLLEEYQVPFNVSVVVTAQNLNALPSLFDYLLRHNVPFNLNFFRDNPLAADGLAVDNPTLIEGMRKAYAVLEGKLPGFSLLNSVLDRVQLQTPHKHACGAGVNYVVVKHTGEIATCQMLLHKPVAKAGTKNLLQVIRHADLRNVPSDQKEGCSSCRWRYVCAGGCPIVTHAAFGRYDTRSPFCETYKALIPEVLRLEALRLLKLDEAMQEAGV